MSAGTWSSRILLGALLLNVAGLAGCTSGEPAGEAQRVAVDFHRRLAAGQAAQSCALLSPRAVEQVQSHGGKDCATAMAELDLPAGGRAISRVAYGREAMVVFDTDTIFLSRFNEGWKVTAAGCAARRDRPFDCLVTGG